MRFFIAILWLTYAGHGFAAEDRVRPPAPAEPPAFREAAHSDINTAGIADRPTDCDRRIAKVAAVVLVRRLIGPGACGGDDMVRLDAVLLADQSRAAIKPAPYLRCAMAEQLALWVREDVAPRIKAQGAALRGVDNYNDYECRSRNRQPGAKPSEHGKGNAIDVRGLTLSDGQFIALTDVMVPKALRDDLRDTVCKRFNTVLGPGSDGYHEEHIHFDLAERHNGYRLCQWAVREPPQSNSEKR